MTALADKPRFEELTVEQWQSFDARHPAPAFQARPAWALALNADDPDVMPAPHKLYLSDGESVLVPLVRLSGGRLGWRLYEGMPLDGHNVILTMDGAVVDGDRLQRVLTELSRCKFDRLVLNFWPQLTVGEPSGWSARRFDTSVIDLGDGAEAALNRMDGKCRRMAGQAQRRGVQCSLNTGAEAIDILYDLLLLSVKRWGIARPVVSKRFLHVLVERGRSDVEIWFANYDGKAIAGGIALYGSAECYAWITALDAEMAVLRPHNILHVTLIKAAAARGMRWYNLGSSEGLPNVKRFKDALGAATIPYARLTLEKGPFKVYRRIRERRLAL